MTTANEIEAAMVDMRDDQRARQMMRFFKPGKGQYGEGDQFLGIRNPQVRMMVKLAWRTTPFQEAVQLVYSPWHEVRLCGLLIMVAQYEKAAKMCDAAAMRRIFDTYLSLHRHIDNWDLVDLSAYKIAGHYEATHPDVTILDEWIRPEFSIWQRRIAMVSTWMDIRKGLPEKAMNRAAYLLDSGQDLLYKAAGWMLREVWKNGYPDMLEAFLESNVNRMPSIMFSYACELMPLEQRCYWQGRRRGHVRVKKF